MNPAWSDRRPILLAHSYYLRYDPKQLERMKPYPPLATLLAAAVLRECGYPVSCFDAMLAQGTEAFEQALDRLEPQVVALVEDHFNFLTKMCTTRMRQAALTMIRAARQRGARIAVSGSDAADHPDLYLAAGADAVLLGEPEETLRELLQHWAGRSPADLAAIRGLAMAGPRSEGLPLAVHRTGLRQPMSGLDALPFPAWDLVDAAAYRRAWTAAHGRLSWNMATSRGCPYRCNWCAKPIFGTRYAQRSPGNVARELAQLRETVAPDHVWFADDIFGLTPRWIESFAEEVEARAARTPFTIQSRANLMQPRTVDALARAGAEEVWLGVESGSQRILDAMDKGITVEQVRQATRRLRARGIRVGWFIQLGYRGEDWDDLLRTRDLIREERPDQIGVSVSYPLPGTVFYERVKSQLGSKSNWETSGDLAMLFAGTYRTEFYRALRDLLHQEASQAAAGGGPGPLDDRWAELAAQESYARRHGTARQPAC